MKTINSYLTFNGNCREAMTFYAACLGGDLMLQAVDGSPMADKMPKEMKECILHSTLTTEGFVIMGSDMTPETGLVKGNATCLMLNCSSEKEIKNTFKTLSAKGKVKHKLETTFWGALFGDFTDKFGNNWILNFDKKNQSIKTLKK
jgi:PhnB protein